MGFSTAIANVIFFTSFLIIAAILVGAGLDFQKTYNRGMDERERLDSDLESSSLAVTDKSIDGETLTLSFLNDGDVDIDLDDLDIFLSGSLRDVISKEVDGTSAERLYEDEVLQVQIGDAYLNATASGGTKVDTSKYDFTSLERVTSYSSVHVLDGTSMITLDQDLSFSWSKDTDLTDPEDIEAIGSDVLVLGDDTIIRYQSDGSGSKVEVVGSGQFSDSSRLTVSGRGGNDPYLFVLNDTGDIFRFDWDGSGIQTICDNGTNVNWSGPVDIFPGEGNIHLLDKDGSIYNISYSGTDEMYWDCSPSAGELPLSGCTTGMDNCSMMILIEGPSSARIQVRNISSDGNFSFISGLSTGYSDMDAGCGLYMSNDVDGEVDRFELGTHIRLATFIGYMITEVI